MRFLNRKARIALKVALTALKAYGASQRARGRAAARKTTGGIRRGLGAGVVLGGTAVYVLERRGQGGGRLRHASNVARGAAHKVTPIRTPRLDDTTLTRKVETEIFRDADVPKGRISVNTENGVVYLRGELERTEQIEALGKAASKVSGVEKVENLLHPPGTPAPMKH